MYFWRTDQLIDDLKHDRVTNTQFKNYYLVGSILMLLSFFILDISPAKPLKLSIANFLINWGLLITWTNIIYKVNGAENGRYFFGRCFALFLPITIKLFVVLLILFLILQTLLQATGFSSMYTIDGDMNGIETYISGIIFSFLTYWRVYVAMRKINV